MSLFRSTFPTGTHGEACVHIYSLNQTGLCTKMQLSGLVMGLVLLLLGKECGPSRPCFARLPLLTGVFLFVVEHNLTVCSRAQTHFFTQI